MNSVSVDPWIPVQREPRGERPPTQPLSPASLLKDRRILILGAVVGVFLALAWSILSSSYEATSSVVVQPTSLTPFSTGDVLKQLSMGTEVQIAKSQSVAELAAKSLKVDNNGALRSGLRVTSPPNTTVLKFSYSAQDGDDAANRANAFSAAYLEYRSERTKASIQRAVDALEAKAVTLDASLKAANATLSGDSASASLQVARDSVAAELLDVRSKQDALASIDVSAGDTISSASASSSGPSLIFMLALGGGLGFAAAIAISWLRREVEARRSGPSPTR